MNKFLCLLLFVLFSINAVIADNFEFAQVKDNEQIFYNITNDFWSFTASGSEEELNLTKKLFDGAGSYSQYLNSDNEIIFTLRTDYEFIKDGELFAINNEELKYYKIVYNGENFIEIPLDSEEVQILFPNIEIIRLSQVDDDNKIWIHKPLFKEKSILFINDSDKYYHKLTPNYVNAQHSEIKGLITLTRYGIYNFKHYGKRDGKLTIYVR